MSDIPKPNNPGGMVSNRSFSGFLNGFLGFKSSSASGFENVASSSSINEESSKEGDSNIKRNGTWAGFVGGEGQPRSAPVVIESNETSYGRPPRPASAGIEKVTWSFFNRNGKIIEEIRPESVGASKLASPIVDSVSSIQPELVPITTGPQPGLMACENNLVQQSDDQVPPVKQRFEFFWSIMSEGTVQNIRELNMFMPQST